MIDIVDFDRGGLTPEELAAIHHLREDAAEVQEFFSRYRDHLKAMAKARLSPPLQKRIDESDVVQEAYIKYCSEIHSYLENPLIPPVVWLRRLTRQVISKLNRKHLDAKCRDLRREELSVFSSINLDQLVDSLTSAGSLLSGAELRELLVRVIERMSPLEKEILSLVHFENRTIRQAALELGISIEAGKKRYRRALDRLRKNHESKLAQYLK